VYAVDVGSVPRGRFGWARCDVPDAVDPKAQETEIEVLVERISSDLTAERPVALGFECPLFVPVPKNPRNLGKARTQEANRAWSAGAGSGALATGIAQSAWILRSLRERHGDVSAHLSWERFCRSGSGLFLWEAFVTAGAKAKGSRRDSDDAGIAVSSFCSQLWDMKIDNPVTGETPVSLIGAVAIWSGWIDDLQQLRGGCLVVKST
jgi:hypothetical protein